LGCPMSNLVAKSGVCSAALLLLCSAALTAQANSFQKSWHAFQVRCLLPFEDFQPAVTQDLVPVAGRAGAFHLDNGALLVVGGPEDLGSRSCAVEGSGLVKGYKEWVALALQTGVYRETDTPGLWMSHEWIEPRIILEKTPGAIRVVESELEA